MKIDIYIGIDPGGTGAICGFAPSIHKCIYIDLKLGVIPVRDWIIGLNPECNIKDIYIEDVHSLFGMSAKSNFSFGGAVREIHTIFKMLDYELKLVTPKVWQAKVGVTAKGKDIKKNVADLCCSIFPEYGLKKLIYGKRGGLNDGRSDATMIAYYNYLISNNLINNK